MSAHPDIGGTAKRVLIVDDERVNRELLVLMLTPEGFQLSTAASGEEALAVVARQPPDLILLDVMMPGVNGCQVASRIKGNPTTNNIPIIMVTALDDRNDMMLGLRAGAEDFLSKPVDRAELCVRVRNLLRLKSYSDYYDQYSQTLEREVSARTAELSEARDRAQRYLDTATVMLIALDREGRITLANDFACAALGWPERELIGSSWFEKCLAARERDQARQQFDDALLGDASVAESTIVTQSGHERVIEWRSSVLQDAEGAVVGTFSSGTDITERNRCVEALQTADERTRFALEAAGIGIWDLDIRTGALQWSDVLESQYGLDRGAFGGTFEAFLERVHPADRDTVRETFTKATESGGDFSVVHRALWPDGTVRWLSGAGRVHLGRAGTPVRGVGISQDITERRTLERQYQQAQKMEAIGQLASGVAHDFNNLLTVILGCAEIVASDDTLAASHRDDLNEVLKAARRATSLSQQLLAFGRQQILHPVAVDLNGLITDTTVMLRRLIGEHIEIALDLAPSLPPALADRSQLEQVVMNLVVNARDAMPDGGTVTIHTTVVELENSTFHEEATVTGEYVMLAVSDTGSGMTKETQQRLFEPFFTTKDAGKGSGLGLSTTYGIVKQSKGYIWVYSELGRGSTFKVYLPRAQGDVAVRAINPAPPAAVRRVSETVLLVEDDTSVRRLSRRMLEDAGYRVFEAGNGDDAERLFAEQVDAIDLLVTDMVMPGYGGAELLGRLQLRTPALRVLYMSGYTEQSAAHQAGIDRGLPFVQKPFTAAEFSRQVRAALDRPRDSPAI